MNSRGNRRTGGTAVHRQGEGGAFHTTDVEKDETKQCGQEETENQERRMAEVFNDYFATIGSNLASEIQPSTIKPEFYLQPTDTTFSLKAPSASTVCRFLNQLDAKKATGLAI